MDIEDTSSKAVSNLEEKISSSGGYIVVVDPFGNNHKLMLCENFGSEFPIIMANNVFLGHGNILKK